MLRISNASGTTAALMLLSAVARKALKKHALYKQVGAERSSGARSESEIMNKRLPNRREFNGLCVAFGASLSSLGPAIVSLSNAPARAAATRTVKLHDGTIVPV